MDDKGDLFKILALSERRIIKYSLVTLGERKGDINV